MTKASSAGLSEVTRGPEGHGCPCSRVSQPWGSLMGFTALVAPFPKWVDLLRGTLKEHSAGGPWTCVRDLKLYQGTLSAL